MARGGLEFVPDPEAEEEIASSEGWREHLIRATALGVEAARAAFEGQGPHPYSRGTYVASIHGEVDLGTEGFVGRIASDVDYAWWIEVGTSDTPTFAPLQHGLDTIGLRMEVKRGG